MFRTATLTMVGLLFLTGLGCQTARQAPQHTAPIDNSGFMTLWATYRQCEVGTDLETMRGHAQQLHGTAVEPHLIQGADLPLPHIIRRWMAAPTNRLSVDPKAMAAACSLHTGQTALSAGRYDIAGEMFRLVLNYPEAMYPYYVAQARQGLAQMIVEVKNPSEPTPARLVSFPVFASPAALR